MIRPDDDTERRRDPSDSRGVQEAPQDECGASELTKIAAGDVFPSVAASHHSVTVHPKGRTTLQMLRIRSSKPTKARA